MITLIIICSISVFLNGLLIWYCRKLTKQFLFFTQNIIELENKLNSFDGHLKNVHELEMFYGDETLGSLIKHSRYIVESIKDFNDFFVLEDDDQKEEDLEEL
jgi:hypothetical protein